MSLIRPGACRPDPPDGRDLVFLPSAFADRVGLSPATGDVFLPERTPISYQGQISSCVANAVCDALELIAPGLVVQLSRLFAYWNSRRTHGEEGVDAGTYIRACIAILAKIGISPEDLWPYVEAMVNERPPLLAYESAFDHLLTAYYRIAASGLGRCDEVEAALRLGHPVVASFQVGQSFEDFEGSGSVVWHPPAHPLGLHAMAIVGVRRNSRGERQFALRNSWGKGWGENGYAWAAEDWIADPFTSDLWVPTSSPSFDVAA